LVLLRLPVVDTLYLSPICFPENPYHRLVKDYKLVADSLNDPVADSRLAGTLMLEEIASLKGLAQTAPDFFRCLYLLLGNETDADPRLAAGMRMVFEAAADCVPQTNADECLQRLSTVVGTQACSTCVRGLTNGGEGDRETASGCSGDQ
jgi:ATP-dependent DNA helicase RecQ